MTNTHRNIETQDLYKVLVKELKEKVLKLRDFGITDKEIASILRTEQPLLKLTIGKSQNIYIGENRVEVHMEPLVKAVFFLFLNHPEGIVFKEMADYREELIGIYKGLRPLGLNNRSLQSIADVTNPLLNSINEKCARIRSAFIHKFDEHLAKNYYITGGRGEPKKITLPRDLVIWE